MELRRSWDFRKIVVIFYLTCFFIYLIIGFQPVAEAVNYEISAKLQIPAINLVSDVTALKLNNHKLDTPATIVGSFSQNQNKTLLIGHAGTVFHNLNIISVGDAINYKNNTYIVSEIKILAKNDVDMDEILAPADKQTIVMMTCIGKKVSEVDSTHRLIVTAQAL